MTHAPPHLRLVHNEKPEPARLEIRITAHDHGLPYGRSRPYRLTHHDLNRLIEAAIRLEARR